MCFDLPFLASDDGDDGGDGRGPLEDPVAALQSRSVPQPYRQIEALVPKQQNRLGCLWYRSAGLFVSG